MTITEAVVWCVMLTAMAAVMVCAIVVGGRPSPPPQPLKYLDRIAKPPVWRCKTVQRGGSSRSTPKC